MGRSAAKDSLPAIMTLLERQEGGGAVLKRAAGHALVRLGMDRRKRPSILSVEADRVSPRHSAGPVEPTGGDGVEK